ncbi:MAG: ABC transporter permease [Clostridia bacterium]|nr:ABC transporter permease [Clostridia bacterium]
MNAIIKKELRVYFNTPIAWVFIAVLMCVSGLFFTMFNLFIGNSSVRVIFGVLPFVFVIMIPLLTMRLFAEERSLKTDQLLLTAPINVSAIVWGKFVAAVVVFGIAVVLMMIYPIILSFYSEVAWGSVMTNNIGFFLLGAALISIGIFISSLTENQFTAGIITIAVLLVMFLLSGISVSSGYESIDKVMSYIGILKAFDRFYIGIINLVDVLYYLSITLIFVLLTVFRIERRRVK